MPELPEVETMKRGLVPYLEGKRIESVEVRRRDLRSPIPNVLTLTGQRIIRLERRGKYVSLYGDKGSVMIVHFGMSGRFRVDPPDEPWRKHDHLRLGTCQGYWVTFHDPRRFGSIDLIRRESVSTYPRFQRLGWEPFDPTLTAQTLRPRLASRKREIKPLLLDQSLIAGIGNIYACESLFGAALDPRRPARTIPQAALETFLDALRDVLSRAISAAGASIKDYRQPSGDNGGFQTEFKIYGQTRCPLCLCQSGVRRIRQAQRVTFYCPRYQR